MKKHLILLSAVLMFVAFVPLLNAQQETAQLLSNDTYTQNTIDTTGIVYVNPLYDVSYWMSVGDSATADIYVDYGTGNGLALTVAVDSIKCTNAGTSKGIILKGGTTNLIPGATWLRFRISYRDVAQGTTAAYCKQDLFVNRRR